MPIVKLDPIRIHSGDVMANIVDDVNKNLDSLVIAINDINGGEGVIGPIGPQGEQGLPGRDGVNGIDGLPGKDGVNGRDGIDGKDGVQGPKGEQGEQGIQGFPGTNGKDGLPGPVGPRGETGTQGPQGVAGPAGSQGVAGPKGDTGAMGPVGTPGPLNYYTVTSPVVNINGTGQTIATATFTSNGFPVYISINGDANPTSINEQYCFVQIYRDGVAIGNSFIIDSPSANINVSYNITAWDTPTAGAHVYTLKTVVGKSFNGSFTFGEAGGPQWGFIELSGAVGPQGPAGPVSTNLLNQKIILNSVVPTALYTGVDVPQWNASYTGQGGQVLVRADITAWTQGVGTRNWYLKKNGAVVATGTFFFNAINTHLTMPPIQYVDTSTGANLWSIAVGPGLNADANDPASITVTETVSTTPVVPTTTTANTTTTTAPVVGGPPVVGGAINPTAIAPVIVSAPQGFASGFVNAGQFVTLDNLKFTVTTGGQRGLTCATVTGTATLAISAHYAMIGGVAGTATNWSVNPVITTTPGGSWFGWSFPNAGDGSTYNVQDVTNKRFYRVTLMIGPAYNSNFISIERLY